MTEIGNLENPELEDVSYTVVPRTVVIGKMSPNFERESWAEFSQFWRDLR